MNDTKFISKRTIEAEIIRSEGEQDSNTINVVFTTGFKGLRSDWSETYFEELAVTADAVDLSRLNSGAPFLDQHEQKTSKTLGVVQRAWIEDGVGKATIKFSKRKDVQDVIDDIKDGILKNISVGYRVLEFTDTTKRGDKTRTLLATKWQPMEISLVAVGFDPHAQVMRSDESQNEVTIISNRGEEMKTTETPVENTVAPAAQEPVAQPTQEPTPIDTEELKRQAVAEFKTRSLEISNAVKAAGLAPEFATDLIERNLSMADASTEIFKNLEKTSQEKNQKNADKTAKEIKQMNSREQAIEALMYRADSRKFKTTEGNELTGASLLEIAAAVVPRNAGESDQAFAKRAITSSDLADVLVSASNKILEAHNASLQPSYQKFTKPMSLRDFKATPIVQLSGYALSTPSEGGDYSESSLTDSQEQITLRQRGTLLSISLKAMINDDLGALQQLPEYASKAGFNDVDDAVYAVINANAAMADTVALFHATHANLVTTAGTNVDVASMAVAEQKLAEAVGLSSEKLELKPKYIIVSPKYAMAARKIVGSMVAESSANFNPYAGSGIEVIVTNKLTDKESWYVVADPAQMPAIVTGTLEGMDQPQVSAEEQFSSSNMRLKVEFHNAAKALNYQAIVKLTVTAP